MVYSGWKFLLFSVFNSPHDLQLHVMNFFNFMLYSLSQNCWDTFVPPFPLTVGVQGLVTEPR